MSWAFAYRRQHRGVDKPHVRNESRGGHDTQARGGNSLYIQKPQFSHAARRSKGVRREKKKGDISEAWCGGFLDQIPFFYFSIFLSRRALVTERNLSVDAKRGLIMHQAHFGNFLALLACFRGISV